MNRKLVVFELNEVPYRVIDRYVADHPGSNLARALPRAARLTSHTADARQLHPKISWQTFHRGVPDTVHGFLEYNQVDAPGKDANPTFWELARRAGKRVGVGASIGSWPVPENRENIAFWMPDPFAPDANTVPDSLGTFQRFNTAAVAHSSRNVRSGGVSKQIAIDLVKSMPALGIGVPTAIKVARQLVGEKVNRARVVRRRNIQSIMSFDVSFRQLENTKPDVATIFSNHVAASMHRYWAAMFPDDYESNNMPADWRRTYKGEIDAAMDEADRMLGRLLGFAKANPEYRVLLVSSMGQHAIEHEPIRNQLVIDDMAAFMAMFGLEGDDFERRPGMEPEYVVAFRDADTFERFRLAASELDIEGHPPQVKIVNDTQCSLLVHRYDVDLTHVKLAGRDVPLADAGLAIAKIEDGSGSTAQHVPEGTCLVFDPREDLSAHSDEAVHDLGAVTASILATLDVPVPGYMPAPVPELVEALGGSATGDSGGSTGARAA